MDPLQALYSQCVQELAALGIQCGPVSQVAVDKRARRTWGTCRRLRDGTFRIGISPRLLAEGVPAESLKETMLHELLHTAAPGEGHRGKWKAFSRQVNAALGTDIRRTATWEDQGLDAAQDPTVKYRFVCTGCGQELVRFRACRFTKYYKHYRCGSCGGKFAKK